MKKLAFLLLFTLLAGFCSCRTEVPPETGTASDSLTESITTASTTTEVKNDTGKESAKPALTSEPETETKTEPQTEPIIEPVRQSVTHDEARAMTVLAAGDSRAVIYQPPTEENDDTNFIAELSLDGESWEMVTVYHAPTRTKDASTKLYTDHITYFTTFDFEGTAYLRITNTQNDDIINTKIRPAQDAASEGRTGRQETVKLTKPCQLSYEVNGDIYGCLHIFANPMDTIDLTDPSILYLKPGVYTEQNCGYISNGIFLVPYGKTVYLAGGAVIRASVHFKDNRNAGIIGRGLVDLNGLTVAGIRMENSNNITVSGIIIRNAKGYSVYAGATDGITVDNIKVISYTDYSDGFDSMACNNVTIQNCFFRTNDDCIAIYGTRWSNRGSSRHYLIENCVLFADNAHAVNIGNHGSGDPKNPDVIEDIVFRDIDVLEVHSTYYTGVFCFQCGSENIIQNILFEDIRVDDFTLSDLVRMHFIKDNGSYGGSISDITFRNITYNDAKPKSIILSGLDKNRTVSDITFESLIINGIRATAENAGLVTNSYVYRVKFN